MRTLTDEGRDFIRRRHLATLSSLAPWGGIHAVPVGYTFQDGVLRVISSGGSQKVRNLRRDGTATVSQFEGARWITFQGEATVRDDPDAVALAVALYAERYRQPRENPLRVAIEIVPWRVMGSSGLVA
ncbi:TIGR03618 family F420-dependent PPOX class oxidoreductase [Microbacterium sp. BK668]|uniref:TIGR03618 family F420-dependent PPOX class oxidoreductase n=1 Tax=Microbacterium sp. BK668 TaxID=2512118 RepID=UPI00105FC238|nr:TIGR03618 family F420-dependent PPOX class oxidoreductase [Microbacterium sp. BK668]TDN91935.1 PPOX class probable F420-dependent enzyme [Microbacterium sp. BK668]